MNFIYLSAKFYEDYNSKDYPELLSKQSRPYTMFKIRVDNIDFAIPFRSNIQHQFAFLTDPENKCGLDFTKSVALQSADYIDNNKTPKIRDHEFKALKGKTYHVKKEFEKYLKLYRKALRNPTIPRNKNLLRYSTLQYFDIEIQQSKAKTPLSIADKINAAKHSKKATSPIHIVPTKKRQEKDLD